MAANGSKMAYGEVDIYLHLGTGWRCVVNFIHWTMGPRADLDNLENKKLYFLWALELS